jgi:protein kinase A
LELVQGGEFFSLLRKTGVLQIPHAAFYASQIVLIFQFLHKNKIVYRDLKPENLLIGRDGYLKLTDFGFAKRLDKNPPRTWTLCGTPEYIAPEILLNKGHSFSVDWWALGILLFEMFTGNPPFVDENPMRIYQKILDANVVYPPDLNRKAQAFIAKLLTPNLSRRLGNLKGGAMDVMMDPFFNGVSWRQVLQKKVRAPYIPRVDNDHDTQHFDDDWPEDSDTENEEPLQNDPFANDF